MYYERCNVNRKESEERTNAPWNGFVAALCKKVLMKHDSLRKKAALHLKLEYEKKGENSTPRVRGWKTHW